MIHGRPNHPRGGTIQDSMLAGRQLQQVAACEIDGVERAKITTVLLSSTPGSPYVDARSEVVLRRPLPGRFAGVAIQQTPRNCGGLVRCPPLLACSSYSLPFGRVSGAVALTGLCVVAAFGLLAR
jgi:hypothetical protein